MNTCKDCNWRNPSSGYCPKKEYAVEPDREACPCFRGSEPRSGDASKLPVKTRICKRCGRELPISEFAKHAKTPDHLQANCRSCMKELIAESKSNAPADYAWPEKPTGKNTAPDLSNFSDQQLIAELTHRGYHGRLEVITVVEI